MIIGITGKSGSGKSTLAHKLTEILNEAIYLDIDKVGHDILKNPEVKPGLVKIYGNSILKEGNVDRKELSKIVFSSKIEMEKLIDITWKYMQIKIDEILNESQDKTIILDWALLPRTKYFNMCDFKIFLDIPYEIRKERIEKRDNISDEEIALREKASINYDLTQFDYVLNKSEEIEKLFVKVKTWK